MNIDSVAVVDNQFGTVRLQTATSVKMGSSGTILKTDIVSEGYHYIPMLEFGNAAPATVDAGYIHADLRS